MMFMTPIPPTIKPTDEIAMAMMPIIPKMLSNCVTKAFAVFTSKLFASENLTCLRARNNDQIFAARSDLESRAKGNEDGIILFVLTEDCRLALRQHADDLPHI